MSTSPTILSPKPIAPQLFTDAVAAVARIEEVYERNTEFLRDVFEAYAKGEHIAGRVRATYPFVRVTTISHARVDSRLSYGFVAGPGVYETTVARPDLFRAYLIEQMGLLIENHGVNVEIGESDEPIPIHFAYRRDINIESGVSKRNRAASDRLLRDIFDTQSRAVALDMESGTVSANGFRFRVPYGTLLCISDKPLHGEIKLAGMASEFYRRRVGQHLEIGLNALEKLKSQKRERLHSRKLSSFTEVAFQ
jgi:hypothetical protein